MKKSQNMTELFEKLSDLKSLFVYGQKLIPIIQSLVDFMKDTIPLLETINSSIAESTNKIPKASNQINNVTSATELATTEILDIVDVISVDISLVERELKNLFDKKNEKKVLLNKILEAVKDNLHALQLINQYASYDNQNDYEALIGICKKIKNDAYNITLSLQVQDITSQQLAAVNHLIESVQERLSCLIVDLKDTNTKEISTLEIEVPKGSAFDPNARYHKENHQLEVDNIIENEISKTSQEEIDKLFA